MWSMNDGQIYSELCPRFVTLHIVEATVLMVVIVNAVFSACEVHGEMRNAGLSKGNFNILTISAMANYICKFIHFYIYPTYYEGRSKSRRVLTIA